MTDHGGEGRTEVGVSSHGAAVNTGTGNQYVTFGGRWVQIVVLVAVLAGVVAGISLWPPASTAQHVSYVVLLVLCAVASAGCLWAACDGTRRKLARFLLLPAVAVVCAALAAGWSQLLAARGDLAVPVAVMSTQPLADGGSARVTVEAPAFRPYLRVRVTVPDHFSSGMCVATATVSVAPVVDGRPQESEAVTLANGRTRDIDLHGARRHIELNAVVHAGKGCLMDLQFESAVLHTRGWWWVP